MCARKVAPIRVLVADRHRIVRAGIKVLLTETGSWQPFEVDEAETTEEALFKIPGGGYGVVLMDYALPGRGGIKATKMIVLNWPASCVLGLAENEDCVSIEGMMKAGARGMILKNIGADTLAMAIRTVMAGKLFYSNEIAQQLLNIRSTSRQDPLSQLTSREKEIFMAILGGQGGKEIADKMGIGKRTLDKHRQHIHYKLGTRTALELFQAGLRMGLLDVQ